MSRSTADALRRLTTGIFRAAGASDSDAAVVAASLLDAELCGHESHGLIRVPEYLRQIRDGGVVPTAQPEIVEEHGATLVVDGNWGFGQVVAGRATEWLVERALEHGAGAVAIRRCGHIGRVGAYPERAAEHGLFALAVANGGGKEPRVAPFGGRRAVFGTNPIAAALPVPGEPPTVIDFSTAAVASGKIRVLRARGEELPEGWILDRHGRPSTRPEDYYDEGMLVPAAGHKGYGLCLLVELLAGCLTGAGSPGVASSGYRVGNGVFLQAFDLRRFGPGEHYEALARALVETVRASPPAEGFDAVLLPGDPERRLAAERTRDGIELADSTWSAIASAADELGVAI